MRTYWSSAPMLRIAFALIAGIGLAIAFGQPLLLRIMAGLFALSFLATFLYSHFKTTGLAYRFRVYNGIALTALIMSFGYILTWFHAEKNCASHFGNFLGTENILVAQIGEPPVIHEKIIQTVAQVKELYSGKENVKTSGKIQLSFEKDSLSTALNYGDVVLLQARIDTLETPKNPGEFSFKRYWGFQQIYYKSFINASEWKLINRAQGNWFLALVYKIRDSFLQIIERYVKDRNDFGVASAIMLGYRDYVNGDITRAYASSGAIHVLSVSGLHVGIMFVMLNFLLKWMDERGRKFEIAKAVFIISFIWFYACLTGMSPPVLRSATMFSLIQSGRVLSRNVNTFNVVAGSAIFLLLLDPFVLTDVGFELSYLAVFGIVYMYPKIAPLVTIKIPEAQYKKQNNIFLKATAFLFYDLKWLALKLCDITWQLIAVSLAAQLATMPLSVLYFYQFPNLFLISNLVVLPLSDWVLFTGTALFAFGHVPYLNAVTGWLFNALLHVLDLFIFGIEKVPFALSKTAIHATEMLMLYLLIILGCWLIEEKRPKVFIASLLLFLGLSSFSSYKVARNLHRKEIIVYSVPKQKAIAFISGEKAWYDFDSALLNDPNALLLRIQHHWAECGLQSEAPVDSAGNFQSTGFGKLLLFEGQKILLVDSPPTGTGFNPSKKLKADLVIISGNPKFSLDQLQNIADFDEVIFDSSNKAGRIKHWKDECGKAGIKYYDVSLQGAYIKAIED